MEKQLEFDFREDCRYNGEVVKNINVEYSFNDCVPITLGNFAESEIDVTIITEKFRHRIVCNDVHGVREGDDFVFFDQMGHKHVLESFYNAN